MQSIYESSFQPYQFAIMVLNLCPLINYCLASSNHCALKLESDSLGFDIALKKNELENMFLLQLLLKDRKFKVSKVAKIRNRYNQVPQLTQDTKAVNSKKMCWEI